MSEGKPYVFTRVGRAVWGDNRFCGCGVNADLVGRETTTGVNALAIAGKRFSANAIKMMDDIAALMCVADFRIWPIKAGRLAGSYGGYIPSFAVTHMALWNAAIGHPTVSETAQVLIDVREEWQRSGGTDESLERVVEETLKRLKVWPGWGVPLREQDERLLIMEECVEKNGFANGEYIQLRRRIAEIILKLKSLKANAGSLLAATLLDIGFTAEQAGPMITLLSENVFLANSVEAAQLAPEELRCLDPKWVRYEGPAPRRSPRHPESGE